SFSLVTRRLPSSTLFPYTTLFRSLRFCTGCNACLRQTTCAITDDDNAYLHAKMLEADGIILGSPCYFGNVTALMKNFMDRTRCRSEEHTSELQSRENLVCRLLLEK